MEDIDLLKKRLLYQSHHRGMREMDIILGRFAKKFLDSLSLNDLKRYEALLAIPDQELYGWVLKKTPISSPHFRALLVKIQTSLL